MTEEVTLDRVHRRAGSWDGLSATDLDWDYVGFEVARLEVGGRKALDTAGRELAIVPLAGTVQVEAGGRSWELGGRASVFDAVGACLYIPCGLDATVTEVDGGAEIAICSAVAEPGFEPRLVEGGGESIARGAGNATRQVATLIGPDFPAHRLLVVEVWTPAGNWSSYPPHKHDTRSAGEVVLEETYYYRCRDTRGFALQRLYSPERDVDWSFAVRDGDLAALPWGYHTTVAAHGRDLYYLNVLAGPGEERSLVAREDPQLADTREAWTSLELDPRVPIVPSRV